MDDQRLPNQAFAAFVRSPHAHARVLAVKTDAARAAKKVLAVLTAEDIKAAGIGGISRHPPVTGRAGGLSERRGSLGARPDVELAQVPS